MKLTPEQLKAARHQGGPALVLAVPGAGKTTMLLARTHFLIEQGISPKRILTITFSRSSARDMKQRFVKLYPELQNEVSFHTIHSFCYSVIRAYERKRGLEHILIEGHPQLSKYRILREIYEAVNPSYPSDDILENLIREISYVKNRLLNPRQFAQSSECQTKSFAQIYERYLQLTKEKRWIDFDDMILLTLEILREDANLRRAVCRSYDYIQVDEGQDTSYSQMLIVEILVQEHRNLFIVADDDQSIYGFRGADVQGLLNLRKTYPDLTIYRLDLNFRSNDPIVTLYRKFIQENKLRYPKDIQAYLKGPSTISHLNLRHLKAQYQYILNYVRENSKEEIVVLYRNNVSSIGMVEALEREGMEFNIREPKNFLAHHWIVHDVLNILTFSEDETRLDLFEKIYYKIKGYISKKNIQTLHQMSSGSVFSNLLSLGEPAYLMRNVRELQEIFSELRNSPMKKALQIIEYDLNYRTYLTNHAETFGSSESTSMRIYFYLKYIAEGCDTRDEFVGRLKQLSHLMSAKHISNSNLTLSTLHGAKGLEFDTVFMIDLTEDIIPSPRALSELDKGVIDHYEEERRLFYVGMSRARKNLYFIAPKTINHYPVKPSEFFTETQRYYQEVKG